jgi:hypothetical protein
MRYASAAFTPDGRTLLAGAIAGLECWDAAGAGPAGPPLDQITQIIRVAAAADGRTVLVEHAHGNAQAFRFWDRVASRPLGEMMPHGTPGERVGGLALSPDSRRFLAVGEAVWLYEAPSGRPLGRFLANDPWLWAAAFAPDGESFVTAGRGGSAQFRDAATGRPVGPPIPHPGEVRALALSADGRTLLPGGLDHTARAWDVPTGKPLGPALAHRGGVGYLATRKRCGAPPRR